mgnify:CR=1 FL=1
MRPAFAHLERFMDQQAARLIHGGWLALVVLVGVKAQTPLSQGDLGVLGLAAAPGLLGLLLGDDDGLELGEADGLALGELDGHALDFVGVDQLAACACARWWPAALLQH